ncbi:galactokinase [Pricia sp.]|uniref:galactokinase n=1 Tax=Pricia sp. TaxID=2268138 RepID=UPI0035936326
MEFLKTFTPELTVESPGRINLIGEHTDYNMGYVLPTAIEKKIILKLQKNGSDSVCHVYSETYDTGFELDLNTIARSDVEWENYILGVLSEISLRTDKVRGFDCVLQSDLPTGSGLSSSAALECGLAFGLNELFDLGLSNLEMVQLSQTAEHTYVGTQCGIMDQFASVMGKSGHVILLDCESLEYDYIPIDLHPYKIILLNTKVSHNLASSEYNTRKRECAEGVEIIRRKHPKVKSLRNVTEEMLNAGKPEMDPTVFNRCSFIIAENKRVLEMAKALRQKDLLSAGQLLYAAHHGISKLYEVSCAESDFLVEFSKDNPDVLGARQTGGGFGGCTLNIVHKDAVDDFVNAASKAYRKKFDIHLEAFEVEPAGGTSFS